MVKLPQCDIEVHEFLKIFNTLESLETFVILDKSRDLDFRLKKEPFFSRIKHLYIPFVDCFLSSFAFLELLVHCVKIVRPKLGFVFEELALFFSFPPTFSFMFFCFHFIPARETLSQAKVHRNCDNH